MIRIKSNENLNQIHVKCVNSTYTVDRVPYTLNQIGRRRGDEQANERTGTKRNTRSMPGNVCVLPIHALWCTMCVLNNWLNIKCYG